jgi:hypothetical protein
MTADRELPARLGGDRGDSAPALREQGYGALTTPASGAEQ